MRGVFDDDDTVSRAERAGGATAHIEPLDEWVSIAPATEDHETRTGLIIPASADVPIRSGIVLAVGDDVTGVAPGDKVLFPRAAMLELRLGGEQVLLVRRGDLVARFTE